MLWGLIYMSSRARSSRICNGMPYTQWSNVEEEEEEEEEEALELELQQLSESSLVWLVAAVKGNCYRHTK